MPNPDVSAIVSSIVAAFDSGMNVFRRLQKKRKQSKLNKKGRKRVTGYEAAEKEEERLCLSLRRGPRQIIGAFETNSGRFGERFRRGDDLAQTSLTHILLVLNAGLMRIISSIMSTDTTNDELARRSLLSLSEISALDAVSSLEDLRQRLVASSSSSSTGSLLRSGPGTPRHNNEATSRRHRGAVEKKRVPLKQQQQQKLPRKKDKKDVHPHKVHSKAVIPATRSKLSICPEADPKNHSPPSRPEVVRGAWVRSRNGSSSSVAVITSTSPKGTTAPTKATIIRKRRLDNSPRVGNTKAKLPTSAGGVLPASCPDLPSSNHTRPSSQSPPLTLTQQQQQRQVRGVTAPEPPQDMSKRNSSNNSSNNRISTLSISSGSTKLGEIPRHKWLTPWEPPADEDDDDEDDAFEEESDRHRNRVGFRFWRRFAGRSDN